MTPFPDLEPANIFRIDVPAVASANHLLRTGEGIYWAICNLAAGNNGGVKLIENGIGINLWNRGEESFFRVSGGVVYNKYNFTVSIGQEISLSKLVPDSFRGDQQVLGDVLGVKLVKVGSCVQVVNIQREQRRTTASIALPESVADGSSSLYHYPTWRTVVGALALLPHDLGVEANERGLLVVNKVAESRVMANPKWAVSVAAYPGEDGLLHVAGVDRFAHDEDSVINWFKMNPPIVLQQN